jgi:hypothetical protein
METKYSTSPNQLERWPYVSYHAEEIGRGDERVGGESDERDEGKPHRAVDLLVERILAEARHPQIVAGRCRRRGRHEEIRQHLIQEEAEVVARGAPEKKPRRNQAANLAERLRDRVDADDDVHSDGVPASFSVVQWGEEKVIKPPKDEAMFLCLV